jgi:hypothetical protein
VLRIDEKHVKEYSIFNVTGVVITSNHKTDGLYLPPDDRRHYAAWSELTKEDPRLAGDYWPRLWAYYHNGGFGHVAAYLRQHDNSKFDPKAPPKKTNAFWAISDSNRAPEESELRDVLDKIGNPDVVTLAKIKLSSPRDFAEWLSDRRNRRVIPHRLEACGYVVVRNPDDKRDGQWKFGEKRHTAYARAELSLHGQLAAIRKAMDDWGKS